MTLSMLSTPSTSQLARSFGSILPGWHRQGLTARPLDLAYGASRSSTVARRPCYATFTP